MVSLARKNLFHDRTRFAITLVGIAFAVTLMLAQVGVYLGFVTNSSQLIDHTGADIWMTCQKTANFDSAKPMPERHLNRLRAMPGIAWARKIIQTWGLMKLKNGATESVQVIGFDPETGTGGPWEMTVGSVREVKVGDSVILDESVLARLGNPTLGDAIEILEKQVKIVGLCRGAKSFTTYPIAFTSYQKARELSRIIRPGETTFIVAKCRPGVDPGPLVEALQGIPGVDVYTQEEFSGKTRNYWTTMTGMGLGIGVTVLLGFIVGTVVVAQTIYASTMEHLREFGTYKAIGATNWDIYAVIVEQALISAVLGYGLGIAITVAVRQYGFIPLGLVMLLPAESIVIMFFVTVGMCLLSSVISIRKATNVDPVIVFRA